MKQARHETAPIKELRELHLRLRDACDMYSYAAKHDFARLEKIILEVRFTAEEEEQILKIFGTDLYRYRAYVDAYTTLLENEYKQQTIEKGKIDLRRIRKTILFNQFPELIRREIKALDLHKGDHVLFIGSGPFPLSSILYHRMSGCTLTCVDSDPAAVQESRKMVSILGMEQDIVVQEGKGEEFVFEKNYAAIVVPLQVDNKNIILDHIRSEVPAGTRVLCRIQTGLARIFNPNQEDQQMYDVFRLEEKVSKPDNITTALIMKTL